jgi:hypothetical protein
MADQEGAVCSIARTRSTNKVVIILDLLLRMGNTFLSMPILTFPIIIDAIGFSRP